MSSNQLELAGYFAQDKIIQIHSRMGVAGTRPLQHCLAQGLKAVNNIHGAVQRNSDLAHEHWIDTVEEILSMLWDKKKVASFGIISGEGKLPTIEGLRNDDMQSQLATKAACVATTVAAHFCWAMKLHSTVMPDVSLGSLSTKAAEAKSCMQKCNCMYMAIVNAETQAFKQGNRDDPYLAILPDFLHDLA